MGHNSDELPYVARGSNFDQCSTKVNCIDFFIFMFIAFSDRYCHYSLEKKELVLLVTFYEGCGYMKTHTTMPTH